MGGEGEGKWEGREEGKWEGWERVSGRGGRG